MLTPPIFRAGSWRGLLGQSSGNLLCPILLLNYLKLEKDGVIGIGAKGYDHGRVSSEIPHSQEVCAWSFATLREMVEKFVAGLRLSLSLVVASFAYATLTGVVMRALEVENTHERHHMARASRVKEPSRASMVSCIARDR